jgi:hypothetical protein
MTAECDTCGQVLEVARTENVHGKRFYEHRDPATGAYCPGRPKLEAKEA